MPRGDVKTLPRLAFGNCALFAPVGYPPLRNFPLYLELPLTIPVHLVVSSLPPEKRQAQLSSRDAAKNKYHARIMKDASKGELAWLTIKR